MRLFLVLHFAFCLALALLAAALGTGYPLPPPVDSSNPVETTQRYEQTRVQDAAIASAAGIALLTAFAVRPRNVPRGIRFSAHFIYMALVLAACHLLWVQPIWAFHHDYTLGVFGWLLVGGEEGFVVMPSFLGAPLTLGCYAGLIWLSFFRIAPFHNKLHESHS